MVEGVGVVVEGGAFWAVVGWFGLGKVQKQLRKCGEMEAPEGCDGVAIRG